MTHKERAEKIYETITLDDNTASTNEARSLLIPLIVAQIREAVDKRLESLEAQLKAADALAMAAKEWRDQTSNGVSPYLADILDPVDDALAAYEKARGK